MYRVPWSSTATPAFSDSSAEQRRPSGSNRIQASGSGASISAKPPYPLLSCPSEPASTTMVYREPTSTFLEVGFQRSQRVIGTRHHRASGYGHSHSHRQARIQCPAWGGADSLRTSYNSSPNILVIIRSQTNTAPSFYRHGHIRSNRDSRGRFVVFSSLVSLK